MSLGFFYIYNRLHFALISFFLSPCTTSSVGGKLGCGRGFTLTTTTTTATRSNKCVLDCIFVEVGMFVLAHMNTCGAVVGDTPHRLKLQEGSPFYSHALL